MHQETPSPSPSSRKNFHVRQTFHRTAYRHCSCQVSGFSVKIQSPVSFPSVDRRQSHQFLAWPLAPCSPFLSSAPRSRLAGCERRWRTVASAPASSAATVPPVAAVRGEPCSTAPLRTAQAAGGLRVFISPLSTLQNRRRGLRSAERALCRRRARELRSVETAEQAKCDRA